MDKEKLKMVAGYYFKDIVGAEPDSLEFEDAWDDVKEYGINAAFGDRTFHIHMNPLHNIISIVERRHKGSFVEAAALAGLDSRLNNLA